MNIIKRAGAALLAAVLLAGAGFVHSLGEAPALPEGTGQIYLYGELHLSEAIYARELELWSECYHQRGMRHLFIECSYFGAQWLNRWMQADHDELLDEYIQDIVELRQAANSPYPAEAYEMEREFFKRIKEDCPDTVFHGTDVGHGQWSFGERYLKYLEDAGQADTEQYRLTKENMEQGKYFYGNVPGGDHTYREEKMTENFIRERDKLGNADIMGIYGAGHVQPGLTTWAKEYRPNMASQLMERYGEDLHCEGVMDSVQPQGTEVIALAGKDYTAQRFGKIYLPTASGDAYMEFWRLEDDAYEDFSSAPLTQKYLYSGQYPMAVEAGQVFVIDRAAKGTVERRYYRCTGVPGSVSKGDLRTDEFLVD